VVKAKEVESVEGGLHALFNVGAPVCMKCSLM